MILSHVALSNIKMSPNGTIWTRFEPKFTSFNFGIQTLVPRSWGHGTKILVPETIRGSEVGARLKSYVILDLY